MQATGTLKQTRAIIAIDDRVDALKCADNRTDADALRLLTELDASGSCTHSQNQTRLTGLFTIFMA
jgi:hypothetical protein